MHNGIRQTFSINLFLRALKQLAAIDRDHFAYEPIIGSIE
jgi:hypothetical protein